MRSTRKYMEGDSNYLPSFSYEQHAIGFANWLRKDLHIEEFKAWSIDSNKALTTEELYKLYLETL